MSFESRYKNLNDAQKRAVDTIDGPLMVIAGPGTGKTELLSMRAANILKKTDTLPNNILCLTFTESGAAAMRERLSSIIGPDAYKVAIHTFHSFGSEIINRNSEYFYNGASFQPANEANTYEIIRAIFDQLDYTNPLASMMNGEFTHLKDTTSVISELKKSGLTSDELFSVLDDNERLLDTVEASLQSIFSKRISKSTKEALLPVAIEAAKLPAPQLPPGTSPLAPTFALSLSHAIDAAEDDNSTKPITAWRNTWLEKNDAAAFVFKDRKRINKLRAVGFIYHQYLSTMQEKQLFDFDDMVLGVVHALEIIDELRFNLQEQYLYIMVDEFQDTNLAQSRLLHSLTNTTANEGAPNIMVVGDDDQAIYSFQGAEISNILQFKDTYESTALITLKDNYRSTAPILSKAREVITQGTQRLERYLPDIDKTLTAHTTRKGSTVQLEEFEHVSDERAWLAEVIAKDIESGTPPSEITVLARRHHELVNLLPYFAKVGVSVNYERRENVLESEIVRQLELLARIVCAIAVSDHQLADSLLPELLAHSAWDISATDIWKLSLDATRQRKSWMEVMAEHASFKLLQTWLLEQAGSSLITSLEPQLDALIGTPHEDATTDFISPLHEYYFSPARRDSDPEKYLAFLEALRTVRDRLRDHTPDKQLRLADFLEFIDLQRNLGIPVTTVRKRSAHQDNHINLMTAHKSKGLEFDHVYIFGAVDSSWGERVRSRSRLITYPENIPIAPAGDSYDERLRLFFVAMTRARYQLTISYSLLGDNDSSLQKASFLSGDLWESHENSLSCSLEIEIQHAQQAWYQPLTQVSEATSKELLQPILENYKLSATHLNAFLDVTRGGPEYFVLQNLLKFPQGISPNAAYGSAIHRTLQQTHAHLASTKKKRPIEDILRDFETNLERAHLAEDEHNKYLKRGLDYLQQFLDEKYDDFSPSQHAELSFSAQQSRLGDAHLTGSLDIVQTDTTSKTIIVTDYKTGKPSTSWKGKTDFEKIKLHKYKQQLMFYKLLVEHSRDYGKYKVDQALLQFVEPTQSGAIVALTIDFDDEELEQFSQLIKAVWQRIITLDMPDITSFSTDYHGILDFETSLLE